MDPSCDPRLARLSGLVASRLGLHFPPERWRDLARGVSQASRELGFPDPDSAIERLLGRPWGRAQIDVLACHLTVGETYFFRDRGVSRALAQEILPALVASRRGGERRLRIWSAACASGEEPYSVAMLLDSLIPDRDRWTVTILATDINVNALRKAESGVYSAWSLRETPDPLRERYFSTRNGNRFELVPRIREMVEFTAHNLAADPFPSLANGTNAMDLILCRNVLMYFGRELVATVVQQLRACLTEGGWLSVSACETSHTLFSDFTAVSLGGATFYRKGGDGRLDDQRAVIATPVLSLPALPASLTPAPLPETPAPREAAGPNLAPPRPPPTPAESAALLLEQRCYAEAYELLRAALSDSPTDPRMLVLLARLAANRGALEEARQWCEQATAADALDAGCHYLLATILQEQGEARRAAEELRSAIFLDQGFVLAHFALGNLERVRGKRVESQRHFKNALALLHDRNGDDVIPDSDGMTSGRLAEVVQALITCGEPVRELEQARRRTPSTNATRMEQPPARLVGAAVWRRAARGPRRSGQ